MKFLSILYICLSLCYVLSEPSSGTYTMDGHFLKKYGKITLQGSEYGDYFYFNTEDFKDGEEIYFKVRAIEDAFWDDYSTYREQRITGVHYQFIDGETTLDENLPDFSEYQGNVDFETINSIKYKTRYFKIKKEPSKFRNSNGNYIYAWLLIYDSEIVLENTKEDEGKIATWIIVVIVVAVVVIIGVAIFCFCYRRKKALAMQASTTYGQNIPVANQYNQPQQGYNYNNNFNNNYNYAPNVPQY